MGRAAGGFLILCFAAIVASASTAAPGRTVVHRFHAFKDGRVAPGVHVLRNAKGYCWTTSDLESRRYTWRCFERNLILDPCFSPTRHASFALCPSEPWSENVLRLQLTRPLPSWQPFVNNKGLPVGVRTTTGKRCARSSGAAGEIARKPITYQCKGGGLLVGFAHRGTRVWTISFASGFKARRLRRVGITDAWW